MAHKTIITIINDPDKKIIKLIEPTLKKNFSQVHPGKLIHGKKGWIKEFSIIVGEEHRQNPATISQLAKLGALGREPLYPLTIGEADVIIKKLEGRYPKSKEGSERKCLDHKSK